jgi:hypothetical protein
MCCIDSKINNKNEIHFYTQREEENDLEPNPLFQEARRKRK